MNIQPDFKELLRLFEKHEVEYMIVGGYAVAFHGYPRFTKDLDLFYHGTSHNLEKLRDALIEFGFAHADFAQADFAKQGNIVTFGVPPVRVDLLNSIDGVSFEEAARNIVVATYGDTTTRFIGRDDLLHNKRSTSRMRDKADVEELEQPSGP